MLCARAARQQLSALFSDRLTGRSKDPAHTVDIGELRELLQTWGTLRYTGDYVQRPYQMAVVFPALRLGGFAWGSLLFELPPFVGL